MPRIQNPVLPGFHPDPSILRVGSMYYIATSTFHWSPGVAIYSSHDLQNWDLAARPLNRISQLNLYGVEPGGGVFAPCLSYHNGIFYLLYTNVLSHLGDFMDCQNYLVQADSIEGPWSEPVYLHSMGFDPSLFHDEDGRKWVISVLRRYISDDDAGYMGGLVLQEYEAGSQKLVGAPIHLALPFSISSPEGPHIYKRGGWYYLLCAEGGTEYGHAATMYRSRSLTGPYEAHPGNPILTARGNLGLPLQRAGHGDLVDTPEGETYMAYLCGRPLPPFRRCILGRETALQKMLWREDGWLYTAKSGNAPSTLVPAPFSSGLKHRKQLTEVMYTFAAGKELHPDFLFLRNRPDDSHCSLTARPGWLRLVGQDSPQSRFSQTVIARRQQAFHFTVCTRLEFAPLSERQMAGLLYIYDENNFYYLHITCNWRGKCVLRLMHMERGVAAWPAGDIDIGGSKEISLRLRVNDTVGEFSYSAADAQSDGWTPVGSPFDASKLSDEYPYGGQAAYTGAMVGMACHDMQYRTAAADFKYMYYKEHDILAP